jgi:methionyl aminopeptidase
VRYFEPGLIFYDTTENMIPLKTVDEMTRVANACQITAAILKAIRLMVRPGISTAELNTAAERMCRDRGVQPAFKGYRGFPAALCCSVNEQVVHGFPGIAPLDEGDIISLDFGVRADGYYGDAAITVPVGEVDPGTMDLLYVTKDSLMAGIAQVKPGNHLGDVSAAIQKVVEEAGYSVVRQFVGHGIGRKLHEEPSIPNFGNKGEGILLKPGMVLAIEPMVNQGTPEVQILADGWTATTMDGKLSAHFEHTVAVTSQGYMILTLP